MLRATILCLMMLAACSSRKTQAEAPAQPKWKPATEYGPYKLGMSYDSAVAALPDVNWNSASLEDCSNDLPLKGCALMQTEGSTFRLDAIPFSPMLSFDKHGVLTEINLMYDKERGITRSECQSIYARVVDVVAADYGPLGFQQARNSTGGFAQHEYRSPGGVAYPISAAIKGPFFVAGSVRSNIEGVKLPTSVPIPRWNDLPYVGVFGHFIVVDGRPNCHVAVSFNRPDSVEKGAH